MINSRIGKLAQLTSKKKVLDNLMENYSNLGTIEDNHLNVFNTLLSEFTDCNGKVLSFLPEEEHVADQTDWFIPKYDAFKKFAKWIEEWMEQAREDIESAQLGSEFDHKCDKEVTALDSVSVVADKRPSGASLANSNSSLASSASTLRRKEANGAALLTQAAALKKKQAIELEETKVDIEQAQLKAKKEQLEIETAIAASSAKIKVLEPEPPHDDGMEEYFMENRGRVGGSMLSHNQGESRGARLKTPQNTNQVRRKSTENMFDTEVQPRIDGGVYSRREATGNLFKSDGNIQDVNAASDGRCKGKTAASRPSLKHGSRGSAFITSVAPAVAKE